MRKQAVLAIALAISVQAFAQSSGVRADSKPRDPIPSLPAAELNGHSTSRQPGWVDENAIPAGSSLSPGQKVKGEVSPGAPEIRLYIARLTNIVLSPDGIRMAAQLLASPDRKRLDRQSRELPSREHNELVLQFRAQWKARYGEDFDLARQRVLMGDYFVLRGLQARDEAILAASQLQPSSPAPSAKPASVDQRDQAATLVVPGDSDANRPTLVLTLSNESANSPAWRLDVPDTLVAQQWQMALDAHLKKLIDGTTSWPANAADAYRMMAYDVLSTLAAEPAKQQPEHREAPPAPGPDNPSIES